MQIQILTVTPSNPSSPKKPGTTYSQLELAFKNLTFQGKVEGRKLVGFGDGKPAHDVLINAQPGDVYEITVVKNGAYNNWTNAVKTTATATTVASPAGGSIGSVSTTRPVYTPAAKSTYETPEERAKKQIYIVRQSSISNAIAVLSVGAKAPPKGDDILSMAKSFEEYVFGDTVDKGSEGFKDLDTMDDVPY